MQYYTGPLRYNLFKFPSAREVTKYIQDLEQCTVPKKNFITYGELNKNMFLLFASNLSDVNKKSDSHRSLSNVETVFFPPEPKLE